MTTLRENPTANAAYWLTTVLENRRSCRAFLPAPVPGETVRRLFEMAQRSASWCNSQAWQVHLLNDAELRALSDQLIVRVQGGPELPDIQPPQHYDGVYGERRRAVGKALSDAVGIAREDQAARARQMMENFRFFGAPHHAVISTPVSLGVYGAVDCGGYVATLLTAAESLGLGAIAQGAIAMYADTVRAHAGIPNDRWIVCGISFGYADDAHAANAFRADRERIDAVVQGLPTAPSCC